MYTRFLAKLKALTAQQYIVIAGGMAVVMAVIVFSFTQFVAPKLATAAYCKAYKDSSVPLIERLSKMEQVAPDEIRSDTKTVKELFQAVAAGASQKLISSEGISEKNMAAGAHIEEWVADHCREDQAAALQNL